MKLSPPFLISSRLLPALHVGGAWIQIEHLGQDGQRPVFRWTIDLPDGSEHSAADLKGPMIGAVRLQDMFETLLAFLGACAESRQVWPGHDEPGENANLFPDAVGEWAEANSDELAMLQCELQETPNLIT
jgi:hypothetical protein